MANKTSIARKESLERERAHFSKYNEAYNVLAAEDYEAVLKHLEIDSETHRRLLEIGCGSGAFSERIQRRLSFPVTVGIDISRRLLTYHKFLSVEGDGQFLPFRDECFDLIVCGSALHHIGNLPQTLGEIVRCLVPGGEFLCYEPNAHHIHRKLISPRSYFARVFNIYSEESFCPEEFHSLLESMNFKDIQIELCTFKYLHPALLGRLQRLASRFIMSNSIQRYVHPWFICKARKNELGHIEYR